MILRTLIVLSLAASTALAQTSDNPTNPDSTAPPGGGEATTPAPPTEDDHPALRIGLILGLISAPRPVNVEVHAKLWDVIGIGVAYTYLPKFVGDWILSLYNANYNDLSVTSHSWEVALRIHPLRGSFFIGANLGQSYVEAVLRGSQQNAYARVNGPFIAPRLGWLWIWKSGVTMGLDAGAQIPLGDPEITFDPPAFRQFKPLNDAAQTVGKTPLPVFNFRLGYSF